MQTKTAIQEAEAHTVNVLVDISARKQAEKAR